MKNNENLKIIGIIGSPLKQSLSPVLHNYWIKKNNINAMYIPFPIKKITNINTTIKTLNILGLNVTIPYKVQVISQLDSINAEAKKINSVNTLVFKRGKIKGYNTDLYGFSLGLKEKKTWDKKKPIFVFGLIKFCSIIFIEEASKLRLFFFANS